MRRNQKASNLEVSNLVVVSFSGNYMSKEVEAWQGRKAIPAAESCRDQIWYGKREDFDDFPLAQIDYSHSRLEGVEAYAFMLRLVSGFDSDRTGETHIKHQFHHWWGQFVNEKTQESHAYQRFVGGLKKDINFIRNQITSQFKTHRPELVARDISGQVKGENIAVIAHPVVPKGQSTDKFYTPTEKFIRVCENMQVPNPKLAMRDFATITHPDDTVLEELQTHFRKLKVGGLLRSNVAIVPFEKLSRIMEENQRVYVDHTMGQDKEADTQIVQAWLDRIDKENSLTHMRAAPKNQAQSSPFWKNAPLDNYFSPEDIRKGMTERGRLNDLAIEKAIQAFTICGQVREDGFIPAKKVKGIKEGEELSYDIS